MSSHDDFTTARQHYGLTFAVLALAGMTFSLLQSLVAPALPEIQRDLHASAPAVAWVLTAYLLSASILTPIVGRLGDMFGKEHTLVAALVVLGLGTLLAGLANSIGVLIVARVIQGGGGAIFPLSFGIIRDEFPRERVAHGHRADLGDPRHRRRPRDRARRPDRRRALLPLAVLDPARDGGRRDRGDAAVRPRVADQVAGPYRLAGRGAALGLARVPAGRHQRGAVAA